MARFSFVLILLAVLMLVPATGRAADEDMAIMPGMQGGEGSGSVGGGMAGEGMMMEEQMGQMHQRGMMVGLPQMKGQRSENFASGSPEEAMHICEAVAARARMRSCEARMAPEGAGQFFCECK